MKFGGLIHHELRMDTDYLVVGSFGNPDWVQSSYGTKIQQAIRNQERGSGVAIVSEDHWARFI